MCDQQYLGTLGRGRPYAELDPTVQSFGLRIWTAAVTQHANTCILFILKPCCCFLQHVYDVINQKYFCCVNYIICYKWSAGSLSLCDKILRNHKSSGGRVQFELFYRSHS